MRVWYPVLLLGVLLLVGCARPAEREAEKRVNALLPRYIGPAQKWETKIKGDSMGAVMRGRLRSVHIVGTGVQVAPDLILEKVLLDFEEVAVDTKAQRLQSVGKATFSGSVRDVVLSRYLRKQRPDIKGLNLTFDKGEIVVHADPDAFGIIKVPTDVRGRLVPRGGGVMDFAPSGANISIVPIPQPVLDYLSKKLNPAVDLSHLTAPLQLERAETSGFFLTLSGSIRPDDLLRLNP